MNTPELTYSNVLDVLSAEEQKKDTYNSTYPSYLRRRLPDKNLMPYLLNPMKTCNDLLERKFKKSQAKEVFKALRFVMVESSKRFQGMKKLFTDANVYDIIDNYTTDIVNKVYGEDDGNSDSNVKIIKSGGAAVTPTPEKESDDDSHSVTTLDDDEDQPSDLQLYDIENVNHNISIEQSINGAILKRMQRDIASLHQVVAKQNEQLLFMRKMLRVIIKETKPSDIIDMLFDSTMEQYF